MGHAIGNQVRELDEVINDTNKRKYRIKKELTRKVYTVFQGPITKIVYNYIHTNEVAARWSRGIGEYFSSV